MQDKFINTNIKLPTKQWMQAKRLALREGLPLWEILSQGLALRMKQEKPAIYGKEFFKEISGEEQE